MPRNLIVSLTSRTRNRRSNMQLGAVLAFVAGAVNAGGFLAVGYYTSHMTGVVSSIADYLALNNFAKAGISFMFLLSFLVGAATTSIVINHARTRGLSSEFAAAIFLESLFLLLFGVLQWQWVESPLASATVVISLLCFIMGLQNAIITKISNAEIRTTHVTGLVTDIGIELGRYMYYYGSGDRTMTLHPEKLKLHTLLFMSFLVGGLCGAVSFKHTQGLIIFPLALLLMIMALVPLMEEARRKGQ